MKRRLKVTILAMLVFIVSTLFIKVEAANASISASKLNATVGDNITISVSMNAAAWNTKLTGAVNKNFAGNSDDGENTNKVESVIFTPSSAGTYTISLGGDVSDGSTNLTTNVSGSVTITVAEKAQETQQTQSTQQNQQTQQTQPAQTQKTNTQVTYNAKNDTVYVAVDNVNLRDGANGAVIGSANKGAALTRTGISTDGNWNRVSYNGGTYYIATSVITTTKPADNNKEDNKQENKTEEKKSGEKSTNKALKDLVVENYKLTPDFDPETTKYTLKVTKEVEELEITPIVQDNGAKYEITGNENFKVGNNIVKITVTAEDGTTRLYTITVTKTNEDGSENPLTNMLKLSKLQIKDIKLDPDFNPETTTYSILVADPSSIKITDVTAIAEDEDVEVTVAETEADENGNRVITIMLENGDESKSGVYQVIVKKGVSAISELQRNKNNRVYFILGGIIGVLAIAIIVVIVLLKKTSDEEDFDDVKDADELSDDYAIKNQMDKTKSEVAPEFDEIIEDSNIKSQILTNQSEYDDEEKSKENFNERQETKRFDLNDEFEDFGDEELKGKGKKKGKHF
jgi:hypothetical protein